MKEIWKDVIGFEGLYKVSNLGRVMSTGNNKSNYSTERVLKPVFVNKRYAQVSLYKAGKFYCRGIHRLLAMAFIANPENKPQINHKDGVKHNNHIDNLEWATASENNFHRYAHGLHVQPKGNEDNQSKVILQLDIDGQIVREWASQNEIRRELGFNQGHISECCLGKRRQEAGFKWRFAQ